MNCTLCLLWFCLSLNLALSGASGAAHGKPYLSLSPSRPILALPNPVPSTSFPRHIPQLQHLPQLPKIPQHLNQLPKIPQHLPQLPKIPHLPQFPPIPLPSHLPTHQQAPPQHPQQVMKLGGNSSTPVEPIRPLLQLGEGEGSGGGGALPAYPSFDDATPTNVTAMPGNTAYLHCLVHNLGKNSVAWVRQRDVHILTVGRYTYTTDQRYQVVHAPGSNDWILKIKYAQVRDSGLYLCQVSTKPVRSFSVHLHVHAPEARILGSPDMHVDKGSTINLTCVIINSPQPPDYIFWYHDGKVVNYEDNRDGVSVTTERGPVSRSCLMIQAAQPSDTGNYTCAPSNAPPTHLHVHVLHGETPAGLQTNAGWRPAAFITPLLLVATFDLLSYDLLGLSLGLAHTAMYTVTSIAT